LKPHRLFSLLIMSRSVPQQTAAASLKPTARRWPWPARFTCSAANCCGLIEAAKAAAPWAAAMPSVPQQTAAASLKPAEHAGEEAGRRIREVISRHFYGKFNH